MICRNGRLSMVRSSLLKPEAQRGQRRFGKVVLRGMHQRLPTVYARRSWGMVR